MLPHSRSTNPPPHPEPTKSPFYMNVRRFLVLTAIAVAPAAAPAAAVAQQAPAGTAGTAVSLADALNMAAKVSHTIRTAEAGVSRSRGQQMQARSAYLPQLNGITNYQRTIQSQFAALSSGSSSSSTSGSGSSGSSGSSSSSSFGDITKIFASPNTWTFGLALSQNIFTAGKLDAASKGAESARTAAEINLDAARAQLALDVAQAYFDAVASDQLVSIADSTMAQAERTLEQTTVSRQVGASAEFDLLRARVARDNQKPNVIAARGNRDVALLRLRQLLGIPLTQSLTLTTPIRDDGVAPAPASQQLTRPIEIPGRTGGITPDTSVDRRAAVRQAVANVEAQEYALRAANWNRMPSVQFTSSYQRFAYPADGTFLPAALNQYYPNWTASLGLSIPIFTGGKLGGERMIAEANVVEAKQTLEQSKELAALDARTSLNQLAQAEASYAASVGTDEQAAKAYSIAEVRYREGISTQVELLQARTQYEQARVNRVTAARDLEVARLRVAFLKDLPVSTGAAARPAAGR